MASLRETVQKLTDTNLIVTPRYNEYMAHRGEDAYPDWVVEIIAKQLLTPGRDRTRSFSASSSGSCLRAQELGFLGKLPDDLTREISPGMMAIFSDGKWRHLKWQADLLAARIITDIEFVLTWERMLHRGSMDGLGLVPKNHATVAWRGEAFGVEVKGVNAFQYTRLVAEPLPKNDHCLQVDKYCLLSGLRLFSVIYENKSTQQFHEWVYQPTLERLAAARKEVEALNFAARTKTLHPILAPCRFRRGKQWEGCPYAGEDGPCETTNDFR